MTIKCYRNVNKYQRNSQIQKSSSGSSRYKFKNPILDTKAKPKLLNKPPLSISTTPSHTKGIFKAFKGLSSVSGLNTQSLTDRYAQTVRPPSSTQGKVPSKGNRSMHSTTTQPKQKYMSFIKKSNLQIEIPEDKGKIPPAPISSKNQKSKDENLVFNNEEKSKALSTKNAQRVTFDFDDPGSYPLQPACRIVIPNHESTK